MCSTNNLLNGNKNNTFFFIVKTKKTPEAISKIMSFLPRESSLIKHIESRKSYSNSGEIEIFIELENESLISLELLKNAGFEVKLLSEFKENGKISGFESENEKIWYPTHVSDLDKCSNVVTLVEPTEDSSHPGFGDKKYIARRSELNKIAKAYRHGDIFPLINYTDEENQTWNKVYSKLHELRSTHTCREYQNNISEMETVGLITPDKVPQIRDLNKYLERRTGFRIRPGAGLLSSRDFLSSLAFRIFQTTLYVRHESQPHYTPEPDIIHEILGHMPMFADPYIAQLSQEIGLLFLGATDEQIKSLSTLYWFTIEVGLCRDVEDQSIKAFGAALLSSFGELKFSLSNETTQEKFVSEKTALQVFDYQKYQKVYYVADSLFDATQQLKSYAKQHSTLHLTYDPFTQTVKELSTKERVQKQINELEQKIQDLKNEFY